MLEDVSDVFDVKAGFKTFYKFNLLGSKAELNSNYLGLMEAAKAVSHYY